KAWSRALQLAERRREEIRRAIGRREAAAAGAAVVVGDVRNRRRADRGDLRPLELGTARSVQDAAELVLSARAADPCGTGLDRVRAGHAVGGGGGRGLRRRGVGGDL